MTKDEIIRKIKERKWTVASTPAHLMTCHPWMAGFIRMRKVYPHYCSDMWLLIKDALGFQAFDERENYENLKQLYDDPKRVRKIMREWRTLRDTFLTNAEKYAKNMAEATTRALSKRFFSFLDECIETWEASAAFDNMAIFTEAELLGQFTSALPEKEKSFSHEYFAAISQPSEGSFVTREHISLLSLARLFKKDAQAAFERSLRKHRKNFYWTANSYKDIKELSADYFRKKAMSESEQTDAVLVAEIARLKSLPAAVEKNRKKILKRFRFPKELAGKITLTPLLGAWLDERKEVNLRGNHFLMLFLKEIGKRYGYSPQEMYYFTPPEIRTLLKTDKGIDKKELADRRHRLVYILSQPEEITLFSGETARELIELFERTTAGEKEARLVRGIVACRGNGGKVTGRVRVILDPEGAEFNDGEILVSTMTRAEYVPFMRKAAAIVTDEGGITCHAAVVSRELNVPCVIGAKRASKILKDGDMIEVDVSTGTIYII